MGHLSSWHSLHCRHSRHGHGRGHHIVCCRLLRRLFVDPGVYVFLERNASLEVVIAYQFLAWTATSKIDVVLRPVISAVLDVFQSVIGHDVVLDVVVSDVQCLFDQTILLEAIRIDQ